MARSQTPYYARSCSLSMSYEQTLDELNDLQKQFEKMELNRRQKVNSIKIKGTQRIRSEYRIKTKDEHIQNVKQRRKSLDSHRTRERLSNANRKERKRKSRRRLKDSVGSNSLKHGSSFILQQKSINERRENVFQRRQQLQREEAQKRKVQFLEKQRKRDQKSYVLHIFVCYK